jgi:hypothetical protein
MPTKMIRVSIDNIYVYVYFNSTLITSNDPNTTPALSNVPVITNDFVPLTLEVTNTTANFGATFFAGTMNISNLLLFTQPGFIYDIQLTFGMTISSNSFLDVATSAVCNISTYNNNYYNCTLLTNPSSDTNEGFVFASV